MSACKLQVIPMHEWPVLRDLYKCNWPQHVLTYNALQVYIVWATKNPQMDDVKISTPDDKWREHGTYLLEDRQKLHYNVLFDSLFPNEYLPTVLRCLEKEPAYTLTAYVEHLRPIVDQHLRDLHITDLVSGLCPSDLYYMPKEECLILELKHIPGFIVKPLTEDYVTHLDTMWPHSYPGSDYLIRRIIRYSLSFGLFKEDTNELCAWMTQGPDGAIGILQVEDAYRRRGLGEQILRILCRKMGESGIDVCAAVVDGNLPSKCLFEKLKFKLFDRLYWFDKAAMDKRGNVVDANLKHG